MAAERIKIGDKHYDLAELQTLAKAGVLNFGEKHDTSSTTPNAQPMHGFFNDGTTMGPFATVGARPGMWNTTVRPRGMAQFVPFRKSTWRTEIIDILTGVTDNAGLSNVTGSCAVGPKSGVLKTCRQTYSYGGIHLSTQIVNLTQVGAQVNRADVPREIWNEASTRNPFLPQFNGITGLNSTASQFRANMFAFGVSLERGIAPVHFVGVQGTQDNTYVGVPTQWDGLDQQIVTGRTDSITGLACPALDSDVVSFNAEVGGSDTFSRTIVEAITDTVFGRQEKARALNIMDVAWAFIMRPDLFRALCEVWACTYGLYRCTSTQAGTPIPRNPAEIAALRDEMFNGKYLVVDGERIPVIVDDAIARDILGNNHYKSDIYFVGMAADGRDLLYFDFFDQANAQAVEYANAFKALDTTTLNNGLYRVSNLQTLTCIEMDFWSELRLILDAPFLSARIDDVRFNSYFKGSDPLPGMSHYYDGGVSTRLTQL